MKYVEKKHLGKSSFLITILGFLAACNDSTGDLNPGMTIKWLSEWQTK